MTDPFAQDPGHGFDGDGLRSLHFVKPAHVGDGNVDSLDRCARKLRGRELDFLRGDTQRVQFCAIVTGRQLQQGIVAAAANLVDDPGCGGPHARIVSHGRAAQGGQALRLVEIVAQLLVVMVIRPASSRPAARAGSSRRPP